MSQVLEARGLKFVVEDPIEAWRVQTLETKEPGTIQWLEETLKPGDVFYDIGANIGIYTVLAAKLVTNQGHVYAFEPHVVNAASLLKNIEETGLLNVDVLTCAVGEGGEGGLVPFYYHSLRAGSSGSQLNSRMGQDGREFGPVAVELKPAVSLRELTCGREGHLVPPTVMKLDVDGQELQVLAGAISQDFLPRSLQVEVMPNARAPIGAFLASFGYVVDRVHYTAHGQKQIDAGANPDDVINNTVFVRR